MKKCLLTLAVSAALLHTTQLHAAGFQLAEYSATGLGRAFAGEAAIADNASVQGRNPAMLTYLEGRQISTGGIYIMPDVNVEGDVGISSPLLGAEPVTINGDGLDMADNALVPNFYYSNQLNDLWTWGLALNSNYGLATELSSTHAAAIFGNKTSVKTVELNPSIAYRVNDQVSVGGGFRFVYGEGEVGASLPGWIEAVRPALPAQVANALPPAGTALKSMEGDDFGYGWQFGTSWQINPSHRLGFAYHSGVKLDLEGHVSGVVYDGGQDVSIKGYIPLELPAFAELASHHQLTDNWSMHASVNWTDWSAFDQLVAYFPGEVKPTGDLESDLVKEENFQDNWRFALGTTYQLSNELTMRAGVALDKSAATDEWRSTTIPDSDRLWFSIGAGYQATENLTVDLAVTYIASSGDAPINESQNLMNLATISFDGEATGDVWMTGLQLSYKM